MLLLFFEDDMLDVFHQFDGQRCYDVYVRGKRRYQSESPVLDLDRLVILAQADEDKDPDREDAQNEQENDRGNYGWFCKHIAPGYFSHI